MEHGGGDAGIRRGVSLRMRRREEASWSLLCRSVPRAVVPIVLFVRIVSICPDGLPSIAVTVSPSPSSRIPFRPRSFLFPRRFPGRVLPVMMSWSPASPPLAGAVVSPSSSLSKSSSLVLSPSSPSRLFPPPSPHYTPPATYNYAQGNTRTRPGHLLSVQPSRSTPTHPTHLPCQPTSLSPSPSSLPQP